MKILGLDFRHVKFWLLRRFSTKFGYIFGSSLPFSEKPQIVHIELTNNCNMGCPYCARSVMKRDLGFMRKDLFKSIIDQISTYRYTVVRLVGLGEPCLHPDFKELIEYSKSKNVPIDITTNGKIFDVISDQEIADSSIVMLNVSVDGHDEKSYNKLRIGGDYATLRKKILSFSLFKKGLKKDGPMLTIRNVLMNNQNEKMVSQVNVFVKAWAGIAERIKFNWLTPTHPPSTPYDTGKICDDIFFNMHIEWNGNVPLCGYQHLITKAETMGNVATEPVDAIWQNPRWMDVRRGHLRRDLSDFQFCRYCAQQCQSRGYDKMAMFNTSKSKIVTVLERFAWRLLSS